MVEWCGCSDNTPCQPGKSCSGNDSGMARPACDAHEETRRHTGLPTLPPEPVGTIVIFAILLYAAAVVAANLTIAAFGPWVSPINAFVLIGLDLTLRDWLHVRVRPWQMLAVIAASGLISWLLNPAAGQIAVASAISFTLAALVDWLVFACGKGSWMQRAMRSNIAGAAVDSLAFPTLAFGVLMPSIVLLQFAAKVAGGALWAVALRRLLDPGRTHAPTDARQPPADR